VLSWYIYTKSLGSKTWFGDHEKMTVRLQSLLNVGLYDSRSLYALISESVTIQTDASPSDARYTDMSGSPNTTLYKPAALSTKNK